MSGSEFAMSVIRMFAKIKSFIIEILIKIGLMEDPYFSLPS